MNQKKLVSILLIIVILAGLVLSFYQNSSASNSTVCLLPTVEFISQNDTPNTYNLSEGFEGFYLKHWKTGRLNVEYLAQESLTLDASYNSSSTTGHKARLWQVKNHQTLEFFVDGEKPLGQIPTQTVVDVVIIDNDTYVTEIVNESENVLKTDAPSFVQYISFTTTHTGNYFVQSQGSIGFAGICYSPVEWDKSSVIVYGSCSDSVISLTVDNHSENDMTGTIPFEIYRNEVLWDSGDIQLNAGESYTWEYTDNQVYRLEVEQRPGHPGNSHPKVTIDGCLVNTPTPTSTPKATLTLQPLPTETATMIFTETSTSTPTNTPTPISTPTSTNTKTNTPTPTSTPTNAPTNTLTPTNTPTSASTPTSTPTTSVPTGLTPTAEPLEPLYKLYLPIIQSQVILISEPPTKPEEN